LIRRDQSINTDFCRQTMSSESETEKEEVVTDLNNPDVTTKYRTVGDIVNAALDAVVQKCVAGADICELCKLGDQIIQDKTSLVYNKKEKGRKIEKGVAFPTCISLNEICGHFCPLTNESRTLAVGDLVKVDVGGHIDGFITTAAHTVVVGASTTEVVEGRKADVLSAAWLAAEVACRSVTIGNNNTKVTALLNKAVAEYQCSMVQGVLSHQMKQYVIDGNKVIISKETAEEKVDEFEFQMNEVYSVDVMVSTGEGKPRETEHRTTVFKRDPEKKYVLKTLLARQFVSEVDKRFSALPFTIRAISDDRTCRLGVSECMRHELLHPYPVLTEKAGEFVAQFKFTVLLLPGGTKKITGLSFTQEPLLKTEFSVKDEELRTILLSTTNPKKKKKKAKDQLKEASEALEAPADV